MIGIYILLFLLLSAIVGATWFIYRHIYLNYVRLLIYMFRMNRERAALPKIKKK